MLSADETIAAISHLQDRLIWYGENVDNDEERFNFICTELGVTPDNCVSVCTTIMAHESVPERKVALALWAGIVIGKKVSKVESTWD